MKRVRLYVPNVILTLLLVFLVIGGEGTMLAKRIALSPNSFRYVTVQQKLAEKGYENLTTYFKTRANSTGIGEDIILDAVTQEDLENGILQNTADACAYLTGTQEAYTPSMDFTELEAALTAFFEDYADENGYAKDDVFREKLDTAISEAEAQILDAADPFEFGALQDNGWLSKLRDAVSYLNLAAILCIAGAAVVMVLLILCNLRQPEHLCYWIGLAGLTAGLLTAIPCLYLTASDFISGFAIKDPQIYAAIVGFLGLFISRTLTVAIITALVGLIGMIGFAFLRAVQREEDAD